MKTVLLTGGTGFIGRNVRESFLSEKYEIIAPSRNELNLLDEQEVVRFLQKKRIDVVIHGACKPSHRDAADFDNILFSNTQMFFNIEKGSRFYDKLIVLGSGAIYDTSKDISSCREDNIQSIPIDEHGFSRYICGRFMDEVKGKYIDLRIFGIFGKYENYSIRFISNMICKSLFNMPLTMNQNRVFSYLAVNDLMPILDFFITYPVKHTSYNIVPDEKVELDELAAIVNEISTKEMAVIKKAEGIGKEYTGDNTRLKKEYPDVKFTPIYESIRSLYGWYADNLGEIDKEKMLLIK